MHTHLYLYLRIPLVSSQFSIPQMLKTFSIYGSHTLQLIRLKRSALASYCLKTHHTMALEESMPQQVRMLWQQEGDQGTAWQGFICLIGIWEWESNPSNFWSVVRSEGAMDLKMSGLGTSGLIFVSFILFGAKPWPSPELEQLELVVVTLSLGHGGIERS